MSSLYMGVSGRKTDFVPCGQQRGRQQGHLHKLFNVFVTNCLESTEAKLVRPDFFYYLIYGNFFFRFRVGGTEKKKKKL